MFSQFKSNYITIPVIVILLLLLFLSTFFLFKCYFGGTTGQRVSSMMPNLNPPKKTFVFIANAVMDSKKLFTTRKLSDNFVSVFTDEERPVVEQEARTFFKNHYGLSDTFLNTFMTELTVNPKSNYTDNESGERIIDGGFVVMIPKGMKLYGKYGGKSGVASNKSGMLPFGYYMFNGKRIRYKGVCPMVAHSTYDGNYSPIDCLIEYNGMTGLAQGVYINKKLKGGMDHIVIKNVLTLN